MRLDAREWLEPDGLGGYAMGTVDGIRTRRYHGLLVAATRPPEGRMALVADLEVEVETAGGTRALSSHRYRGDVVHPDGAARRVGFAWQPWPRWEYLLEDGTRIAQEVIVAPGAPQVLVRWRRLAGDGPARLRVRPLLSGRDHHALHHENPAFRFDAEVDDPGSGHGARVTWRPYDGVPAIVALASGGYRAAPDWYRGFRYAAEAARGLDAEEDLASPGVFTLDLADGDAVLAFGAGDALDGATDARALATRLVDVEAARRAGFATPLHRAADAYVVTRGAGRTVVAGYPWFTDWGRDTFISLRGLCLATGRLDEARGLVLAWSAALSRGMLPNRFVEDGTAEYNTVDAALWFVVAADALVAADACDAAERRALDEAIDAIVAGHAAGTRHRIAATDDGLLACGEPGIQLTWMDARIGDRVITPRTGKPVEIQALWANALAIAGRRTPRWRDLLARTRAAFTARFWDDARGHLRDVVDCDHVAGAIDPSLRPNQLFAVGGGLPLALLDGPRARAVVDVVEAALWTPAGLRSLAPDAPGYRGRYQGGVVARDEAYHQGTVWTWLTGPFVEAWVKVRGGGADVRAEARRRFLAPVLARLEVAGLGHLAEIADGDPPHAPRGCPFQAWSVAEALRLDVDVLA
ncbi:MAG: glycogen debranching enzyme family protein [Kofleriaceae bacterium]|nr:glycogen debranching enzyme family protein [Kofleriaceae bacterium]